MKCSFCGKKNTEVKKMIAGTGKVAICDECVKLSHRLVKEGPITMTINIKELRHAEV